MAELTGHSAVVSAADWLSDGSHVITASWDRTANLYDVETGSVINSFIGRCSSRQTERISKTLIRLGVHVCLCRTRRRTDKRERALVTETRRHNRTRHDLPSVGLARSLHDRQCVSRPHTVSTAHITNHNDNLVGLTTRSHCCDRSVTSAAFVGSDKVVSSSDDTTCKVWDLKNMRSPITTIRTDSGVNRLLVATTKSTRRAVLSQCFYSRLF